ncbi:glycoside hydrolase family 130 protein [Coprobacter sp. LH1063]|uniref:Glycoside hydrolase family 130 protein n=1 Tax=Coprobacter tertius TaxID=2944915 RepID=A0ABT1MGJ0_9BACT|nr:glycoside hydrolase family 130 protein [Coprobacter tertius]MCP9610961.1 glycoside hydrolase family 130 protein [Coprobacter tertius]
MLPAVAAEPTLPSWALGGFVRVEGKNPVIVPKENSKFDCPMRKSPVAWEESDTFNPAAVVKDGKICVLYRAEDNSHPGLGRRTSRIGLGESKDGVIMKRRDTPVMYPGEDAAKEYEWPGGCEDPRVAVTDDGLYVMMYTSWNQKVPRLAVATSRDLLTWEKYGPAFAKAYEGRFKDLGCKSGSIVTKVKNGKQVITQINGKYFMYWGEDNVYGATSEDLVNWIPVLDEKGNLKKLMSPREGYFDSMLSECGPPAVMTDKGIVLLYNGKNHPGDKGDKKYPSGVYAAGQALFDKNNPERLVDRLDEAFFRPMESFEQSGQYKDGTVFVEGLVYYKKKWYLYYGCADSFVGVAVYDPDHPATPDPVPVMKR